MPGDAATPPPGVSRRAILIGAACALLLGLLIPYSDLRLQGTWIAACHLPIAAFFLQFILIAGLNTALRLVARRLALSPGELLTAYAMMLVASGIPSFGLTEYLIPTLAGATYFASAENKWEDTFYHLIPKWFAPTDPKVITPFFEGLRPGQAMPWEAWIGPLAAWTALALLLFALMVLVSSIFRRQWIENEHLIFPLVQLPLDMVENKDNSLLPPFFRSRAMWAGAAIPLIIHSWNGVSRYFPAVPTIPLAQGLNHLFVAQPWNSVGLLIIWCHFSIIGFSYLLSAELSFSLWFFFVLFNLESVALAALGIQIPPIPDYPTRAEAALQMLGAFFVLFGYMAWLVRGQLARGNGDATPFASLTAKRVESPFPPPGDRTSTAARSAQGASPALSPSHDPDPTALFSPRDTLWGIATCVALYLLWTSQAGQAVWFALSSLIFFMVIALVLTRLVSEGGLLFIQAPFRPTDIYQAFVGVRWVPVRSLTIAAFVERIFMTDLRTFLMPSLMDSFKLAHGARLNNRRLLMAIVIAVVISVAASYVSLLTTCYHSGAVTLSQWFCVISPQQPFRTLMTWIDQPRAANPVNAVFVGVGVAVTMALSWARVTFPWWPLHPLGYAMGPSWPLIQLWFSIFIGWLMKSLLMRYGSGRAYRRSRPFFLGLVVGEFLAAGIWVIVSAVTGTRGHRFFLT